MYFYLPCGKRSFWLFQLSQKCGPPFCLPMVFKASNLIQAYVSFAPASLQTPERRKDLVIRWIRIIQSQAIGISHLAEAAASLASPG